MFYLRFAAFFAAVLFSNYQLSAQPATQQRVLGAGVLKVIPPVVLPEETRTYLPTIRGYNPKQFSPLTAPDTSTTSSLSKNIVLRREVGCLEFAFTALKIKRFEVPQPTGKMQIKTVWYLPFRVRNLGGHYVPQTLGDVTKLRFKKRNYTIEEFKIEDPVGIIGEKVFLEKNWVESEIDVQGISDIASKSIDNLKTEGLLKKSQVSQTALIDRFFARFILEGRVQTDFSLRKKATPYGFREVPDKDTLKRYTKKEYLDRFMPSILEQIQKIEDPNIKFYDTVSISKMKIPPNSDPNSPGVWGVAVWQDLDPRLDYITIKVTGLSNATRIYDMPTGKNRIKHKTLQLNFWRPGDMHDEFKDKIRYGIPFSRSPKEQKEICQFYDLPGPVISVQEFDLKTDKRRELFIVEGNVDRNFDLDLQKSMDAGQIPDEIRKTFAAHGIAIPAGAAVKKLVDAENVRNPGQNDGIRWESTVTIDGVQRSFRFIFRPRAWQKIGEGVKIIKRVESIWTYR